jgi:hypothetical protein
MEPSFLDRQTDRKVEKMSEFVRLENVHIIPNNFPTPSGTDPDRLCVAWKVGIWKTKDGIINHWVEPVYSDQKHPSHAWMYDHKTL